ncbi:helix-hairpin-helix domain-containing protein [Ectobacillus panaciterrae]|uniref:helix-hairpin-helix domain-containing protein n=1 Tax=Ectobacillus panaciterrae TaxID=363872 RepID=UPI0009D64CD6|nr:helix-hairpin-helix domain-containing protein [Ectobacillus panaciterrae]
MFYWNTQETALPAAPAPQKEEKKETRKETKKEISTAMIDVKGAVKREGVYEMQAGARVRDAIGEAGGFLPEADASKVNLAQFVQDQMLLYVPKKGEQQGAITSQPQKIVVNIATKEELEKIPGIGPKKAESILKYREQHGPFQKAEDLLEVDGIGEKSLEKIKEQIIVP